MQKRPRKITKSNLFNFLVYLLTLLGIILVVISAAVALMAQPIPIGTNPLATVANIATIVAGIISFGVVVSSGFQYIRTRFLKSLPVRTSMPSAQEQLRQKIEELAARNSEIGLMLEIMEQRDELEQKASERRAFWQGVAQNFFFYLLGVVTPVALLHFHIGS